MGTVIALPAALFAIGIILGGAVIGFLYLFGVFGQAKSKDIKSAKDAADFVIEALKEKIAILEQKIIDTGTSLVETNKRLDTLQVENTSLKEVLQGRDKTTQEYQAEARKTFAVADQVFKGVTESNLKIDKVNKNVERLATAIEKHLTYMEKQQTVTVTTGGIENPLKN